MNPKKHLPRFGLVFMWPYAHTRAGFGEPFGPQGHQKEFLKNSPKTKQSQIHFLSKSHINFHRGKSIPQKVYFCNFQKTAQSKQSPE
jgi:hypothetical protein